MPSSWHVFSCSWELLVVPQRSGTGWCNVCIRHWMWTYLSITQHHNHNIKPTNPSVLTLRLTTPSWRNSLLDCERWQSVLQQVRAGVVVGSELIWSCRWRTPMSACCLIPPRQPRNHSESPRIQYFPPIITDEQQWWAAFVLHCKFHSVFTSLHSRLLEMISLFFGVPHCSGMSSQLISVSCRLAVKCCQSSDGWAA